MLIEVVGTRRIKKRKPIEYHINENGCWICTSHYIDNDGYPTICCNWRQRKMSRYIYERFVGKIPNKLVIRHKCDTRNCINPEHLEVGTSKENTNDMIIRGRDIKDCGENNGAAKLTQNEVNKIRTELGTKAMTLIGKEYGVSSRCIRNIRDNKTWNNIKI